MLTVFYQNRFALGIFPEAGFHLPGEREVQRIADPPPTPGGVWVKLSEDVDVNDVHHPTPLVVYHEITKQNSTLSTSKVSVWSLTHLP